MKENKAYKLESIKNNSSPWTVSTSPSDLQRLLDDYFSMKIGGLNGI